MAQEAHTDLRDAIAGLKSGPIPDEAFLPALQQRLEAYRQRYAIQTGLRVAPDIGEHSLDPIVALQVLRVVQEALANARRHGHASRVEVALTRADGRACITISDDGQGFDAATPAAGDHYGLAFMRERMDSVGGQIAISSQPGAGTQVALSVPLHKEAV